MVLPKIHTTKPVIIYFGYFQTQGIRVCSVARRNNRIASHLVFKEELSAILNKYWFDFIKHKF